MATNREKLIEILEGRFPDMWMKSTEEFDGRKGGIWTGEGSTVFDGMAEDSVGNGLSEDHIPMFDYDADDSIYEMGINKKLVKVLDEHGWYAEFYDAGTVFIYKA